MEWLKKYSTSSMQREHNEVFNKFWALLSTLFPKFDLYHYKVYSVNPQFKPRGTINVMVHNHPGSNQERVEIET